VGPPAQALDGALERGRRALEERVEQRRRVLEQLRRRLAAAHPRWRLAQQRGRLATLRSRLDGWSEQGLRDVAGRLALAEQSLRGRGPGLVGEPRARLGAASARLEALSPLGVLARGYALARDRSGTVVTDATRFAPGEGVEVTLARGRLDCEVRTVHPQGLLERPR
jgi:exodeoxyribonuclease VII large subunit